MKNLRYRCDHFFIENPDVQLFSRSQLFTYVVHLSSIMCKQHFGRTGQVLYGIFVLFHTIQLTSMAGSLLQTHN